MSVLKSKRNHSKTQFVATAREIFIEVEKFRTKLSERYSRTYGNDIYRYARNVMLLCESASSIWVKESFKSKLWLSSPTMHGEEQHWVDEAIQTNWVSTVGANII